MTGKVAASMVAAALLLARPAFAHRIDEYLQATVLSLQPDGVRASMRLVPGISVAPAVIAAIDSNGDGTFSEAEERAYAQTVLGGLAVTSDGRKVEPELVSWSFPQPAQMREGLGEIHIEYRLDLPPGGSDRSLILETHPQSRNLVYLVNALVPEDRSLLITAQKRNEQQSRYELDYRQTGGAGVGTAGDDFFGTLRDVQFAGLFHLGMRHIAEGTDHLLFLLALLLPAPLLVRDSRWGPPAGVRRSLLRILGIVTAFTIGHSITLTFAALDGLHVPSRPVEVAIAVSIFVSAIHALRPIVPGKESLVAGCFGLIHGLAFAATLDRLGLGRWERVGGVLAFNLGIEAMQMLVVAAVLPSLLLMSRTRAYTTLRVGGALFAGASSLGWIVERLFDIGTPVNQIVNALALQAPWVALSVFVVSLACRLMLPSGGKQVQERALAGAALADDGDHLALDGP